MYTAVTVDRRQWTGLMVTHGKLCSDGLCGNRSQRQPPRHSANANCILLVTLMTWEEIEAFVAVGAIHRTTNARQVKYLPIVVPVSPNTRSTATTRRTYSDE